MTHKKIFYNLTIMMLSALVLSACNANKEDNIDRDDEDTATIGNITELSSQEQEQSEGPYWQQTSEESQPETIQELSTNNENENAAQKAEPNKAKSKSSASYGTKETLYISTYGANGKVWGHVTMNGNTGRGTIHDDGENSYSITVTRHGGELYGTDQNGRQYVFRL